MELNLPRDGFDALIRAIEDRFHELHERINLMATQADVDAITAEISTAIGNIQAEINSLETANPEIDLTGLKAAADQLAGVAPDPATTTAATAPPENLAGADSAPDAADANIPGNDAPDTSSTAQSSPGL
jgi:hypothetical protein